MNKKILHTAILQTELHWENAELNRTHFSKLITSLESDVDLIILPEMFTTGFTMNASAVAETMEGPTIAWMKEEAAAAGAYITGSMIITDGHAYYNRLIWMRPDGSYIHYDKRHLFSYAGEDKVYSAGTERVIADCYGWRINLNICYDLRFPVSLRHQGDYDCLLFVANWPAKRALHWKTLLQARAIENLSYVIACNRVGLDNNDLSYTGDSALIGPDGKIESTPSTTGMIISGSLNKTSLSKYRNDFAFAQDSDAFRLSDVK